MLRFVCVAIVGASVAASTAQGEISLGRFRLRSKAKETERDQIDSVVRNVKYQSASALPALPSVSSYQAPEPEMEPVPAVGAPSNVVPQAPQPAPAVVTPAPVYSAPQSVSGPIIGAESYMVPTVYTNVKVRDARKIHPCAVPTLVAAPDPCNPCCQVCVEVCVPPCEPADVICRKDGKRVIYDFGKYEVKITVRGEHLVVNYDR
jgi:hypothetical protein